MPLFIEIANQDFRDPQLDPPGALPNEGFILPMSSTNPRPTVPQPSNPIFNLRMVISDPGVPARPKRQEG
jgi:hypothetical protein